MESHTMASENAEEQVSQAKPTLRDRNTVEDCEKVLYRFQGSEDRSRKEEVRDLNCILTTAQRMILNKGQLAETRKESMTTC